MSVSFIVLSFLIGWRCLKDKPKRKAEKIMKKNEKKSLLIGSIFIAMFTVWTVLIQTVDVQPLGQNGTGIGFADILLGKVGNENE